MMILFSLGLDVPHMETQGFALLPKHVCVFMRRQHIFTFVQLLEKRVVRGGMLVLEQHFELFPDHFLSQQIFSH